MLLLQSLCKYFELLCIVAYFRSGGTSSFFIYDIYIYIYIGLRSLFLMYMHDMLVKGSGISRKGGRMFEGRDSGDDDLMRDGQISEERETERGIG